MDNDNVKTRNIRKPFPKHIAINPSIHFSVLQLLPSGVTFLGLQEIRDMKGNKRRALLVIFKDKAPMGGMRKSHFCADNGEYLGEA